LGLIDLNISLSSYLTNGPNKLEYYIPLGWKGFQRTNTLAYCAHSYVSEEMRCCEYDPKSVNVNTSGMECIKKKKKNLQSFFQTSSNPFKKEIKNYFFEFRERASTLKLFTAVIDSVSFPKERHDIQHNDTQHYNIQHKNK
jgi:hypothetical protein